MFKSAVVIIGLCGALFAAGADAAIISGTWTFTAGAYSGTFSFTNLDTTQFYTGSTAAGFTLSTSFDTTGDGGNAFDFDPGIGQLVIGGLANGVHAVVSPANNDWNFSVNAFWTNPAFLSFAYEGTTSGSFVFMNSGVTLAAVTAVPEPATLALLGLGLAGIAVARRKRH